MSKHYKIGDVVTYNARYNKAASGWLFLVIGLNKSHDTSSNIEWFDLLFLRTSAITPFPEESSSQPGSVLWDLCNHGFDLVENPELTDTELALIKNWMIHWEEQHQEDKARLLTLYGGPVVVQQEQNVRELTIGEL